MVTLMLGCADKKQPAQSAANPDAGKKIVQKSCVGCHGLDGKGANDDIPNLAEFMKTLTGTQLSSPKRGIAPPTLEE